MDADDEKSDVSINIGREIGCYRIVRFLGKGGMSEVYEAEHVRLGSRHAVKFFTYEKNVDGVKERFLAEGKLLAKLAHPRVVRVTDAGIDPETQQPYFVMGLVADPDGNVRSLADVPKGAADEQQIADWYEDVREGLAYIHSRGIIHRDLKLENVLIGPDGHAVLTDFGISKIAEAEDGAAVVDSVQTIVNLKDGKRLVMGSIGYMAPELEMGAAASPQSDYYALGVLVFHLLTGTWCDARTDVAGYLETFDPVWRQILPKLLHSNLRGRECPSWRELKEKQEEDLLFEMESELESVRGSERKGKRRLWVISTALLAILVAAGLIGVFLQRQISHTRQELSRARQELSRVPPPTFEDVFSVPNNAPEEAEDDDTMTRVQFEFALVDAWILVHTVFSDLRSGEITYEKAVSDIERLAKRAASDESDNSLYGPYTENYVLGYQRGALAELLRDAAKRMKERYPEK